jgi:hypothetical protein
VHSTFLRHQQQCSAPLKAADVFHGKGVLRLAGVRVAVAQRHHGHCKVTRERACPRLGKRACSEQAEQRWCRGHTVVVHVDALGQQRRRKHEAWPHHGAVLRTAWARRPQRARAGPSARSLGGIVFVAACGGCCGGTRHGGMCSACSTHDAVAAVLPCCQNACALPSRALASSRWATHSGAFRTGPRDALTDGAAQAGCL